MSRIFQDAISLGKAVAAQVAAGFPLASKDEQKRRHEICSTCPLLKQEEYKCGVCNCFLLIKIPLGTSVCPKGYWSCIPPVEEKEVKDE